MNDTRKSHKITETRAYVKARNRPENQEIHRKNHNAPSIKELKVRNKRSYLRSDVAL